jgi:serine/threonine-protein phosphatase 2A activator
MVEDASDLSGDPLELTFLTKRIFRDKDIPKWIDSPAYIETDQMLCLLSESVRSKPRSVDRPRRPVIHALVAALNSVRRIMEETPPYDGSMRFGNWAFRNFLTRVYDDRADILRDVCDHPEPPEYFVQSFGSWTRIDFGTGHEYNFLAFITSLAVLGVVDEEDFVAIVFDVFWTYWDLLLDLQDRYNQEAAGSHGVWGIDDYVALPFVFGSSQLIDHPVITPASVIDPEIAKANREEYAYCKWVDHVIEVKSGTFAEHSRVLWSLRRQPHFQKLNGGTIKMYRGEVMERFTVVQHFRFGSLLKWEDDPDTTEQ